jgi:hypothetical protein
MAEYSSLAENLPRPGDIRGSTNRAFLLAVTSGTKTSRSLNFCSQIGTNVYKSQIIHNLTTSDTVTLKCSAKRKSACQHRMKIRIKNPKNLILRRTITRTSSNGNDYKMFINKFDVKNEQSRCRENFEVIDFPSEEHTCIPLSNAKIIEDRFNENAVNLSIEARKIKVLISKYNFIKTILVQYRKGSIA